MPKGDKSDYTDKQKRKAEHIEESYDVSASDIRR
uniref:Plasmid stabilization protein n=1 Tax=Rhizobium leguminosarum bv. trifolii TaxID=386 RepID=A0A1C9I0B3_RHILT|nr:plasmid stabilization protein [Rhizobium leguminosarum bv. trifolii]